MADITLNITIPSEKAAIAAQGFLKIFPNTETIPDPEAESGQETTIPKYTTKQWVEEKLRRTLVRDVRRGLQMSANEDAIVADDDGIAVIS